MVSNSLTRFLARISSVDDEIMSELIKMLASLQRQSTVDWWYSLGL